MSAAPRRINLIKTGHIATVVVVVVGFLVTYISYFAERNTLDGAPVSGAALAVATVLGGIYLWLLVTNSAAGWMAAGPLPKAVYFIVLVALLLLIEFLLGGAYVIWLISMPLIALATTDLPPQPRWLVYIAALLGVVLPIYRLYGSWEAPLYNGLTYITASVFVIAFVRITQAAESAQQGAERMTAELADANRRLGEYAIQAEELATTQERNRLAREIHDNLGHYLTVINVQIKAAQALLAKDPAQANAALDKAGRLAQEGLAAVRHSVSTLRESPFGQRTLPEAVAALAAETQAAGVVAELRVQGQPRPLDPRAELTLYRAAQEGLTNVRKHARASRVDLLLDYGDPSAVSLLISDNGLGATHDGPTGFGLLGLQERARLLGGRFSAGSAADGGYRLWIALPTDGEPYDETEIIEGEAG
jgi:signal transduction histidine kinase